jgi:3-methylcrotonyl-CoA carboxylase beta subunit
LCLKFHHFLRYKVIARVVDGSKFDEFKKLFGSTLITGVTAHWVGAPHA